MTNKRDILLIILILLSPVIFGQNSIKKITTINYTSNINKQFTIDTTVELFNINGIPETKNQTIIDFYSSIKKYHLLGKETIDSSANKIHTKYYYSDSLKTEEIVCFYKDSVTHTYISSNIDDTAYSVYLLKPNQSKEKANLHYRTGYTLEYRERIYNIKNNIFIESAYIASKFSKLGMPDTVKYCFNKLLRKRKDYAYNPKKKEWFIERKERFDKKGKLIKSFETFYRDYDNVYFTTRTKYEYNRKGQKVLEIIYDCYINEIEKKIIYEYYQ
jgi:hypothetical protein